MKCLLILLLFIILHITHSSDYEDKILKKKNWFCTRKSKNCEYKNLKDWANAEAETFVPQVTQENEKTKEDIGNYSKYFPKPYFPGNNPILTFESHKNEEKLLNTSEENGEQEIQYEHHQGHQIWTKYNQSTPERLPFASKRQKELTWGDVKNVPPRMQRQNEAQRLPHKYKTEFCKFFINGNYCKFGNKCRFSHEGHDPNLSFASHENKEKLMKISDEKKEQKIGRMLFDFATAVAKSNNIQSEPQSATMGKLHEYDENISLNDLQGRWISSKDIVSFQVKGDSVRFLGYDTFYKIQETHDQFIFADWILKKHSTTLTWKKENEKDMLWYPMVKAIHLVAWEKEMQESEAYYDRHYFVPPRQHRLIEKQIEQNKEKEEIEQKLKEYFVSNLNAFIDCASTDNVALDYLEIEIPGKALVYLGIDPAVLCGPFFYIYRPDAKYETFNLYITGYTSNESHDEFSAKEFQLNNNETCDLIDYSIFDTQWQKLFKLNGNHTFKFKFYFHESKQNHKVMFGGQMFNFDSFQFDLETSRKFYSCKVATQVNYFWVEQCSKRSGSAKKHFGYFRSSKNNFKKSYTSQEFVTFCENAGMKFKFTFYSINDHINMIYNNDRVSNIVSKPTHLQENHLNNFDYNFQHYGHYTNEEYEIPQNFNFQNMFYHTSQEYQNFDWLEQEFSLEINDSFDQHSFFQDNIFDYQSFVVELSKDINFKIFEKQFHLSNFYHTGDEFHNFDLELEYFLDKNENFEHNSFFQDNIFDNEISIVELPEDINPTIFQKQ